MKNFLAVLFLAIAMFITGLSNAHAILPVGAYMGIRGGVAFDSSDTMKDNIKSFKIDGKNSTSLGADVGIRFMDLRGELEYIHRFDALKLEGAIGNKNISSNTVMANLYYNVLDFYLLKFFVNGGLGYTTISSSSVKQKDNLTWSLGFGGEISMANLINFEVGYRYLDMGSVKIKDSNLLANNISLNQASHDIYIGVRVGF